ncbi:MAG: hypothetical protein AB8G96_02375 [Phycisphaerales bacterium]
MGFRSGSVSYARFRVHGGPEAVERELVEQLASGQMGPMPPGDPPEIRAGWTAGTHVLDVDFNASRIVFGETLVFGLRIDTHRVPADVRKAYRALAEKTRAAELADGDVRSLGRGARREAREEAEDRCRRELMDGKHRNSKHIEVLWRVNTREVFAAAMSDAAVKQLRELFRDTLGATLEPLGAGSMARERLELAGRSRDYEDLRPSPFTPAPPAAEIEPGRDGAVPLVSWTMGPGEPQDFLGNEFISWLWWRIVAGEGAIEVPRSRYELAIDRSLDMQCAWDATGKIGLRGHAPHRLPEAADALRTGKWPRKVGLLIASGDEFATLTLQGDRFVVAGLALPKPEEPPADDAEAMEHRLTSLEAIDEALMTLYAAFVDERSTGTWASIRSAMAAWMKTGRASAAPAVRGAEGGVRPPAPAVPPASADSSSSPTGAADAAPSVDADAASETGNESETETETETMAGVA